VLNLDLFVAGLLAFAFAMAAGLWIAVPRRRWPKGWKGSPPVLPADSTSAYKLWGSALHVPERRYGRRS
jgi:hypothetical protein